MTEQAQPFLMGKIKYLQEQLAEEKNKVMRLRSQLGMEESNVQFETEHQLLKSKRALKHLRDDYSSIINYMCMKEIVMDNPALQDQFDEFFMCLALCISEEDYNKKLQSARLSLYNV